MIALDTHVLMWLVTSPEKLSQKAQKLINREVKSAKPLLVSSISIWEICILVKKGRLKLSMDVDAWLEKIENLPFLQFIPIDNKIAAKSVNLPGKFHDDPADRIIVASARESGAALVTSDQRIRKYSHIQSVW